jgi:recombination protein RecT
MRPGKDSMSGNGKDLQHLVESARSKFAEVAPKWFSVERVVRLALAARSRNQALAECTADSFLLFLMRCAETGLEPIGAGGCWAVPYRNSKTGLREVQFIPDWRGLIQLGKKTEQIKHAYGEIVCQNDRISYQKGDDPRLTHEPALTGRGEMIGAYCVVVLPDNSKHIEYMDKGELDGIRKRSKAANDGPWVTDYEQMAIKTVVKRALKPFASSPEMQTAIAYDNAATGLMLPDKTPIAEPMPISVQSVEVQPKNEEPKEQPVQEPADVNQDDYGKQVTVVVGNIKTKVDTKHKPPEWTLYSFTSDGERYSTFDEKMADALRGLVGQTIDIVIHATDKGNNIKGIVRDAPASGEESQEQEPLPI